LHPGISCFEETFLNILDNLGHIARQRGQYEECTKTHESTRTRSLKILFECILNSPPAEQEIKEGDTKDDLQRQKEAKKQEVPAVDDVVKICRDEVVDLPDQIT
jgi:hypothetical protein